MGINYVKLALAKILDNDLELLYSSSPDKFTHKSAKLIYTAITKYVEKYQKVPTYDVLEAAFTTQLSVESADITIGYLQGLKEIPVDKLTTDELITGLAENVLVTSLDNNIEDLLVAAQNRDVDSIRDIARNLLNTQKTKVEAQSVTDIEYEVTNVKSLEAFLPTLNHNGCSLGGVTLISGSSGGGKSVFALNQAIHSYLQGENILYINCEMGKDLQLARMLSTIEHIPFSDIYNSTIDAAQLKRLNRAKDSFFNRENKFKMVNAPINDTEIFSLIEQELPTGLDVVFIDYLQIVDRGNSRDESWKFIENFVKKLHQISLKHGIVIVSPIQINSEDTKETEDGHIKLTTRGSRELEFSSTLWLHIHQTQEERAEGVARLFTVKARNNERLTYMIQSDFKHMTFKDTGLIV